MTNADLRSDYSDVPQGLPQSAAALAYAGALPLIVATLLIMLRPTEFGASAITFMLGYGSALIIFFGGVRWGITVMRKSGPSFSGLLGAIIPLAIGLVSFHIEDWRLRFIIIIITLPVLLWDDMRATRRGSGAPDWYLGVRAPLTALMLASFITAFVAAIRGLA